MLHAVIMAGGSGTRFWPRSRQRLPKQFLALASERSLLQETYDRIVPVVGPERVLVATGADHAARTREQLPDLPADRVVGEPTGRDTAACVGLAAALIARDDPDARLLVLAADHLIQPAWAFQAAARAADALLQRQRDALLTFGIRPTGPSTAYGYLSRDTAAAPLDVAQVPVHRLKSFHEKPDLATAERFVAGGTHYWNSGIFGWRADTILGELAAHASETAAACRAIAAAWGTPRQDEVFRDQYGGLRKISIDYAVMERTALPKFMIEAPFQWDDVGSWLALERLHPHDEHGNVAVGTHVGLATENCIVVGEPGHAVATLGVRNLIVVHTPDATLVADRSREQEVKKLLDELARRGLPQYL